MTMTNHGDDCYFFYYSTCTKGDGCPFRHCEAAMGNEMVCSLWQEGRCYRPVCKFRHMEITKNRKEIPCYWETQPAGCQKPHCAFFHEGPRCIDGVYVPPDKGLSRSDQQPPEEPAPPPAVAPPPPNPQLRGVIKTEAQEPVPSPTHPPVVINPADDDEDEDDQFSEEGEDGRVGPSPRKSARSGEPLDFGVSTLEEIRLRRALEASLRRAGYPLQSPGYQSPGNPLQSPGYQSPGYPNGDKDVLQPLMQLRVPEAAAGPRPRGSVAERLGRKVPDPGSRGGRGQQLRRSLARRLGGVVHEEAEPPAPPQEGKSVKERLGSVLGTGSPPRKSLRTRDPVLETRNQPVLETRNDPGSGTGTGPQQIRIKTLDQIRQEKAAKTRNPDPRPGSDPLDPEGPGTGPARARSGSRTGSRTGSRRTVALKESSIIRVKTFSEVMRAQRRREREPGRNRSPGKEPGRNRSPGKEPGRNRSPGKEPGRNRSPGKEPGRNRSPGKEPGRNRSPEKSQAEPDPARPSSENRVRVKTLQEIRREKAERLQARQDQSRSGTEDDGGAKKARLLPPRAVPVQSGGTGADEPETEPGQRSPAGAAQTRNQVQNQVQVKSFQEIMEEKRRRKQEMEEQNKDPAGAEPGQNRAGVGALKRKLPPLDQDQDQDPASTGSGTGTGPGPVRKILSLKARAAASRTDAEAAVAVETGASREVPAAPQGPAAPQVPPQGPALPQVPAAGASGDGSQNGSPEHASNCKVRPKLNVRPSVVRPSAPVKPGPKRRGGRSAVAAVKPLSSSAPALEEPQEEAPQGPPQEPQGPPQEPQGPHQEEPPQEEPRRRDTQVPREQLQTFSPVQDQNQDQNPDPVPVQRTGPAPPKARRASAGPGTRSCTRSGSSEPSRDLDDFEELIQQFSGDQEDLDPDIGEEDLLQELSQMIDS